MRFTTVYGDWQASKLTQSEAAEILGVCERTFRRQIHRFEADGEDGLIDQRVGKASSRKASDSELNAMLEQYSNEFLGWNVKHYYSHYRSAGGTRSYSWVKSGLQAARIVATSPKRGKHRKRRERKPLTGMMIHQDASTHEWIKGEQWDLVVTMDDATNEHYSMFFVAQEGTASSMRGVREVIEQRGLFSVFYSDRGSHYWHTPTAGGKVDKRNPTQFGRALQQLGIQMIAAYSPEARGRSERQFKTHQDRLVKELAKANITNMADANRFVQDVYLPAFNAEFMRAAEQDGTAFVPLPAGVELDEVFCEVHERVVGKDNCVRFNNLVLQLPADEHRFNYVKARLSVRLHWDGSMTLLHGPRVLARFDFEGALLLPQIASAA